MELLTNISQIEDKILGKKGWDYVYFLINEPTVSLLRFSNGWSVVMSY